MTRPIVSAVDPRILTGLQLWVRADDINANDGAAQTWVRDHSGKSNSLAAFDTSPVFLQSNLGYPAWQFSTTTPASLNDFRASRNPATINTAWAVLAHKNTTFDATSLGDNEGAVASVTASSNFPNIVGNANNVTTLNAGTARTIYIDGHSFGLNTAGDFANAAIVAANGDMTNKHIVCVTDSTGNAGVPALGRYFTGNGNWVGYVYEVVLMTGVPDATVRNAINQYFANKYGITLVA